MSAGMSEIREALAARLGTYPDFTAYEYVPDGIYAPAAFIEPDRPFVDYQKAFQTGQICWTFLVTVLVNRMDEPSAQKELDKYLDPMGGFVSLLQSTEEEDALSELVSFVNVLKGNRYGAYSIGGTTYLGAQLLVEVMG